MPIWEYKVILPRLEVNLSRYKTMQSRLKAKSDSIEEVLDKYGPQFDSIAEVLNRYGQEGWELVAVETTSYGDEEEQPVVYLKRPVSEG